MTHLSCHTLDALSKSSFPLVTAPITYHPSLYSTKTYFQIPYIHIHIFKYRLSKDYSVYTKHIYGECDLFFKSLNWLTVLLFMQLPKDNNTRLKKTNSTRLGGARFKPQSGVQLDLVSKENKITERYAWIFKKRSIYLMCTGVFPVYNL